MIACSFPMRPKDKDTLVFGAKSDTDASVSQPVQATGKVDHCHCQSTQPTDPLKGANREPIGCQ